MDWYMVTSFCACAKPLGGLYKWLPNNGGVKVAFAWIPTLRLAFQRQCCDAADEKRLSTSLTRTRNQVSTNAPNYCSREAKIEQLHQSCQPTPSSFEALGYSTAHSFNIFSHFSTVCRLCCSLLFFCKDQYWYLLCDGE